MEIKDRIKELRRVKASLLQPYPKRVSSVASDAPAYQAGEGGATLTATLFKEGDM